MIGEMENKERKETRGWRNVLGERVIGEDARGEGAYSHMQPRDEGNKWFEEPAETGSRTKDTLPASPELPSNSRGEKEGEEEKSRIETREGENGEKADSGRKGTW